MKISNQGFSFSTFLTKSPLVFILYFLLALLSPLILARLLPYNAENFLKEVGIACGMLALMLFIMAFFYTGRFNFISARRGIDITLMLHRKMVAIAIILAIAHIMLISPFSMPNNLIALIISWILIITQIVIFKLRKKINLKYERWRLIHEIAAIFIISLLVIHAISDGKYSSQLVMSGFWVGALIVAISSLLYIHHYLPIINSKKPYKIVQLKKIANKQWDLVIEPKENFRPMQFYPGQFAFVSFGWSPFRNIANPFSFSGAPSDLPQISFTIKEVGDLTQSFKNISLDTDVYLFGPYGHMNRDLHKGPPDRGVGNVFIAAGIGITPLMSMIRESINNKDNDPIKLFYSCRHEEDILYKNELKAASEHPNIDIHILLSRPNEKWWGDSGRIDFDFLKKHLAFDRYEKYLYFICGRTKFIHDTIRNLESLGGIPVFNIIFEDFSIYD